MPHRPVTVRDVVDDAERTLDEHGVRKIRRTIFTARVGRLLPMPVLLRSPIVRRLVLRDVAEHGDQLSSPQVVEAVDDLPACAVVDDIFSSDEEIAPLDPSPCPVTLAWSSRDRIVPPAVNGAIARARVPEARFVLLAGCGHVPMIDDPVAVAETILRTAATPRDGALRTQRRGSAGW